MSRERVIPHHARRDDGTKPCRGSTLNPDCGGLVAKGRVTWCSQGCADWVNACYSQNGFRLYIWNRDHGICAGCGVDTEKLKRVMRHARNNIDYVTGWHRWSALRRHLFRFDPWFGLLPFDIVMNWWAADHIVPLADGGEANPDTNGQTLCVPCHKAKTKAEAAARATVRQIRKRQQPGPDGQRPLGLL